LECGAPAPLFFHGVLCLNSRVIWELGFKGRSPFLECGAPVPFFFHGVLMFDRPANTPTQLTINDKTFATGSVVNVQDNYGLQIKELVS